MSEDRSPYGESLELDYYGRTIRALMINGVPFMALPDILDAHGMNDYAAEHVHGESFPSFGKHVGIEQADPEIPGEPQDLLLLSPTGVLYWAMALEPRRTTKFTAWARRETRRLCPNPAPGDPTVHLMLVQEANGWTHVPPGPPSKYSGWRSDWEDLRGSDYPAWYAAADRNAAWQLKKRDEARRAAA